MTKQPPHESFFLPLRENMAPDDDAFKSPLEQIPEGYQKTFAPLIDRGLDAGRDIGLGLGSGLNRAFLAMEAMGASQQGRQPLWLQLKDREDLAAMEQQKSQDALAIRREEQARHLQQLEETKKQHQWTNMISIDKEFANDPDRWEMGMQALAKDGFTPASHLLEVGGKKMAGELESSLPFIQRYFPDFAKKYETNPQSVSRSEVGMVLQNVKKLKERRAQADANAQELAALESGYKLYLETGDPSTMQPGDAERLIELRNEQEKKQLELEKLRLGNAVERKKLDDPAVKQTDQFGHEREAISQELFEKKYGKPMLFKDLQPDEKATVNKTLVERQGQIAGSRTSGVQGAMGDVPVAQLGKSQEYRDPVTGHAAPGWATQRQLQQMGYVNIEPTQVQTVSQLSNVDAAMKEILGAGAALVRQETGSTLFDIPLGFLQTPIIDLMKKYAGDPNAALLQSALSRIAPSMAKLAGDTGNIAVAEQQIYKDSVFSNGDTLESFAAKIKSIMQAQKRTKSSLGFVDDEKSYTRRLAIQGKTDEQIKAILEERRRMQ